MPTPTEGEIVKNWGPGLKPRLPVEFAPREGHEVVATSDARLLLPLTPGPARATLRR